jgi:hypothetical protein
MLQRTYMLNKLLSVCSAANCTLQSARAGELDKDALASIVREREAAELARMDQEASAKAAAAAAKAAAARRSAAAELSSGALAAAAGAATVGLVAGGLADGAFAGGDAPWASPAGAVVAGMPLRTAVH